MNLTLLFGSLLLWKSKLLQDHIWLPGKWGVVILLFFYYIGNFYRLVNNPRNRRPRSHKMSPALRASLHWVFQSVVNYITENVQAKSDWADWNASVGFLFLYIHFISFLKFRGRASDFGAKDSLLTITVAFVSHMIGGFASNFLIPVISALVVLYTEISKLPIVDEDGDVMDLERQTEIGFQLHSQYAIHMA